MNRCAAGIKGVILHSPGILGWTPMESAQSGLNSADVSWAQTAVRVIFLYTPFHLEDSFHD
jgi:hypothetical protein